MEGRVTKQLGRKALDDTLAQHGLELWDRPLLVRTSDAKVEYWTLRIGDPIRSKDFFVDGFSEQELLENAQARLREYLAERISN